MKYDLNIFNGEVEYYKKGLKKIENKSLLVVADIGNRDAFFSFAPFSKAAHDSGKELCIILKDGKSNIYEILKEVYGAYEDYKGGVKNNKASALLDFIREVEKKTKGKFERLFRKPEMIEAGSSIRGMELKSRWFKDYRKEELYKTAEKIWESVYAVKQSDRVSIGFELVPSEKELELPLEDYLDSYAICWAMIQTCKAKKAGGSATAKKSPLAESEPVSDLKATLLGCELSKDIKEQVFVKFNRLSRECKIDRLEIPTATFFIHGKGYGGKHLFGETIGYPSPDRKTRWLGPGSIIYKLDWSPQTKIDSRLPRARVAFTETLPVDVFIQTCNIDWKGMVERTKKIQGILERCSMVFVEGSKVTGGKTSLAVSLITKDNKHRWVRKDDGSETHSIINKSYLKRTGIKAGSFGNIPAGEVFMTPEYIEGTFVGDVVISLDRSYVLDKNKPIVVSCSKKGYRVVSGERGIIKGLAKKKGDAWKMIAEQERHKSIPKELIELKKKNFNKLGEFAINTNPKARLCNYLIVNEKIANMIHIALGSGFEPDRSTEYHTDIVIDAPRQKLDIWGSKGSKKYWILKKGKFVV